MELLSDHKYFAVRFMAGHNIEGVSCFMSHCSLRIVPNLCPLLLTSKTYPFFAPVQIRDEAKDNILNQILFSTYIKNKILQHKSLLNFNIKLQHKYHIDSTMDACRGGLFPLRTSQKQMLEFYFAEALVWAMSDSDGYFRQN